MKKIQQIQFERRNTKSRTVENTQDKQQTSKSACQYPGHYFS
jgi:hypothetical protein